MPNPIEDLNQCITRPVDTVDKENVPARYNSNGVIDSITDTKAVAIKLNVSSKPIYKVKVDRTGNLYNPKKEDRDYGLNKRDRFTNEASFKFRAVSKKAFDTYITFLQKRHDSLLTTAQREL